MKRPTIFCVAFLVSAAALSKESDPTWTPEQLTARVEGELLNEGVSLIRLREKLALEKRDGAWLVTLTRDDGSKRSRELKTLSPGLDAAAAEVVTVVGEMLHEAAVAGGQATSQPALSAQDQEGTTQTKRTPVLSDQTGPPREPMADLAWLPIDYAATFLLAPLLCVTPVLKGATLYFAGPLLNRKHYPNWHLGAIAEYATVALSLIVGGGGIGAGLLIAELFFRPLYYSSSPEINLRTSSGTYDLIRIGSIVAGSIGFGIILLAAPAVGYFVGTSGSQDVGLE